MDRNVLLLIIFIFLFQKSIFSQSKVNVDSLIISYNTYLNEDTFKIKKALNIATILSKKDVSQSYKYVQNAMSISETLKNPLFIALCNQKKAEILISDGKYDDALPCLNQSLIYFEKNKKSLDQADIYFKLGTIAKYKRENIKAKEFYEKSLEIFKKLDREDLIISTEDNLSSIYGLMGQPKKAIEIKNKIINYYTKKNLKQELAQTYGGKSRYHFLAGETSEAVECLLKALKINEEIGDLRSQLFNYQNLAVIHGEINNPEKAIEYAEKGLKINQTVKNKKLETGLNNAICVAYAKMSNHTKAIECYTKVIQDFESANNYVAAAENYGLLAGHLLQEKQFSKAYYTYKGLLDYYEKNKNAFTIPQELYRLGDLIMSMPDSSLLNVKIPAVSRLSESMIYLQRGLVSAQEQKSIQQQSVILNAISRNYEAQGKYQEAYDAFRKYIILKDSISGDEVQKKITKSEIQYEFDKKELALKYEKQLTDKQLANQLLLNTQQKQSLTLKEQALELSQKEKELEHLAFLKEQAEKQEKTQQLTLAEEREKNKEQALNLSNLALSTQKKQNLYLALAISFLLIGLSLLAYFYQTLRKQKNIISQQNQLNEHTISILSHDIKEPLLGVKLLLKKLNVNDPILSQASSSLENQINSVNGVLNNLLKMKKIALHDSPKDQKAHVNDVIQNVIKDLTFNVESKNLTIQNELKDLFTLPIAPEKLQIVVHNILSNAIKYSYPNQHIRIFQDGNGFCVQDYGIGIGKEQAMKLMTDVNTSHPGTQQEKGQGMGLFLIGILLQGEQVRVLFESPEVGGTIVKIMG
jgi:signal transduction histidine kinase/tetratricopeptide (TPR) repeat protein